MGQHHLHHTPEEQAEVACRYRHSYYERNRKDFSLKNKEHYFCRKSNSQATVLNNNNDSTCRPEQLLTEQSIIKETAKLPASKSKRQLTKKKTDNCYKSLEMIKNHLMRLLGGHKISLQEYLNTICKYLLGHTEDTLDAEDIRSAIDATLKLEKIVHIEEDGALQYYGVGPKLLHVQSVSRDVHCLLSALEEIFFYVLSDITQLQAAYDQQELMFQANTLI
ncbi:hypothetical protein F4604DRAFT_1686063 [Suillus subluteus]|nr:hypothetical protein F4604DRAFT_1686063 [Suillus subluteus]